MSIKKGRFYLTFKSSLIAFFLIKFFVNYSQPFCNLTATLQLIPRGDTNLYTGDILVVLMDDEDTPYIRHQFKKICSNEK